MSYHYRLYAFGSNGESPLGLGTASDKVHTPTEVPNPPPLEDIKAIRGGGNHTLILTNSGSIWGAGSNQTHQLGRSDDSHLLTFKEIYHGISLCAATWESSGYVVHSNTSGNRNSSPMVYTEGRALHGELGRGDLANTSTADLDSQAQEAKTQFAHCGSLDTSLPSEVIDFAAGTYHYIAILRSGSVWGWGRSRSGQLGPTTQPSLPTPTSIQCIPFPVHRAVCGQNFTYLVSSPTTGAHLILGSSKHNLQSKAPSQVKGWKDIGATWNAIFVLFQDGSLVGWGKEDLWELVPKGLPEIEQMAVGSDHIVVVTREGKVVSWGWAAHGNCGDLGGLAGKGVLRKGYVTEGWNEIEVEGEVVKVGAGYSTSFVVTREFVDGSAGK